MSHLLHPDEAERIMGSFGPLPGEELVPLERASGRVLARELRYLVDQPPFDKAAMDGFAMASRDASKLFRVIGTVPAGGQVPSAAPRQGECYRVMTGAPMPPGCDRVHRVERTEERDGAIALASPEDGSNVIARGENARAGDALLSPKRLGGADIGILASSGYAEIPVRRRPTVGVVSTGNELVPSGSPLSDGAIYDSNGPMLVALAREAGADAEFFGVARDDGRDIAALALASIAERDITILSGGVSMGDFDHVPAALESAGVKKVFHNLAMKPGKPTWFGVRSKEEGGAACVFGMPGNPVSTFVNFHVLVRALLDSLSGLAPNARTVRAPLASPLARRGADRVEFVPSYWNGETIAPVPYSGSSMLSALALANCLARLEIGETSVPEGALRAARLV